MSRWFPKVEDDASAEALVEKTEPKTVMRLWTDKNQNTYKVPEKTVAPDADYSVEQRSREIALNRAKLWEYQEHIPDERREILIDPEDHTLADRLRRVAISEARMELGAQPSRDPEFREPEIETPFNMRGLNEDTRRFDALGQRDGIEPTQTRPLPTAQIPKNGITESIHLPDEKNVTAFKAIFRNLMGLPAQKQKSESEVKKYDVDGLVRSVVDSGYTKAWTPPDQLSRPMKPDAVAFAVGKRALDAINAFKTMPEMRTLSAKERDELTLSVGRTMLNVSMTGPAAQRMPTKISENAPLANDSIRRKILASIHPEIMKKALGPELTNLSTKNNLVSTTVRAPEGTARAKERPETMETTFVPQAPGGRTLVAGPAAGPRGSASDLVEELRKKPTVRGQLWHDPYA